mmetsp:Transcript_89718/g.159455  ORF Transcript_89718/g.159455 Transcript_89718/m.159455 type:complete len:218 (-) Transcript_89718:1588-2241(-)
MATHAAAQLRTRHLAMLLDLATVPVAAQAAQLNSSVLELAEPAARTSESHQAAQQLGQCQPLELQAHQAWASQPRGSRKDFAAGSLQPPWQQGLQHQVLQKRLAWAMCCPCSCRASNPQRLPAGHQPDTPPEAPTEANKQEALPRLTSWQADTRLVGLDAAWLLQGRSLHLPPPLLLWFHWHPETGDEACPGTQELVAQIPSRSEFACQDAVPRACR